MLTQPPRGEAGAFCDNASFYWGKWAYSSIQAGIVHVQNEFVGFCSCCPTRKSLVCFNQVNPASPRSMHVLSSSFEELLLKLMAFSYTCGSLCTREALQWKKREEKISVGYKDYLLEYSKQQNPFHEESLSQCCDSFDLLFMVCMS